MAEVSPAGAVPPSRLAGVREALVARRASTTERIEALTREFTGIVEAASLGATDDEHDPEGATIAFERSQADALLSQAHRDLAELDAADGRLTAGTYGVCVRCGKAIAPERLQVRPAASTCIRCAAAARD